MSAGHGETDSRFRDGTGTRSSLEVGLTNTAVRALRVRSFAAWLPVARDASSGGTWPWRRHGSLWVWWEARRSARDGEARVAEERFTLLLGDDAEWKAESPDRNLAGGVPVRLDPMRGLMVHTSIVGLPPVYLYRGSVGIALASDIYLLRRIPGLELEFDAQGVGDLARIGHPVDHRTLFRDVTLVPAGSRLCLQRNGTVRVQDAWALPEATALEWPAFLEAQAAAFTGAVQRTDLRNTFLSLSAGLDTRTIFAALADQGRLVPAVTMTGPRWSLDARIAARLCRAYGVAHDLVTFDRHFTSELPRFLETASRLSGGLATLSQAPEVYLYDHAGGFGTRLSGNLGNQVGRGGTEGVSLRSADAGIFGPGVGADHTSPRRHWLLDRLAGDVRARISFILRREIAFTSVGNYTIGNHYAAQQSPYADRALIETLALRPADGTEPSGSQLRMRLRDLRHRFLGEPMATSFQRTYVRRVGGFAARCPINWGWRAAGGVSPTGWGLGMATLVGMFARAKGLDDGMLRLAGAARFPGSASLAASRPASVHARPAGLTRCPRGGAVQLARAATNTERSFQRAT